MGFTFFAVFLWRKSKLKFLLSSVTSCWTAVHAGSLFRLLNVQTRNLMRFSEQLLEAFKEASRNFTFLSSSTRQAKNFKPFALVQKDWFNCKGLQKTYSSGDQISFKLENTKTTCPLPFFDSLCGLSSPSLRTNFYHLFLDVSEQAFTWIFKDHTFQTRQLCLQKYFI